MSARTVTVAVGETLLWDGEVVRVVELDGRSVALRLADGRYSSVGLAEFVSRARGLDLVDDGGDPGLTLAGVSAAERELVARRAGHVREVLTGYSSGHADAARPGEPRQSSPTVCP